jgi:hypothetical protein
VSEVPTLPTLPPTKHARDRAILVALIGVSLALLAVVVGLIVLGYRGEVAQDAITALATIGGSLAGGFAGWIARGTIEPREEG